MTVTSTVQSLLIDLELTNPDAIYLNEVLRPSFGSLIAARYDLEHPFPRQANLVARMVASLSDIIFDAEMGILNAHPEKRVAILQGMSS